MKNPFTQKSTSKANFYTTIVIVAAILLAVNTLFSFFSMRLDLTEGGDFSVSTVTKRALKDLDDIVNIKAYFTAELPGYLITVRQEVNDILKEYENYSGGKIRIKFLDPNKSQDTEQEAQRLGIPPLQFNVVEKDKFQITNGYLGIAVLYGEKSEIIPIIENTSTLEYDLTTAIKKITQEKVPNLGFWSGNGTIDQETEMKTLSRQLEKQYILRTVKLDQDNGDSSSVLSSVASVEEEAPAAKEDDKDNKASIPDDIDTLIIAGASEEFSKDELLAIDEFVKKGKGLLILQDGVSIDEGLIANPNKTGIEQLLADYGLRLNQDLIVDRYNETASFSSGFIQFFVPYAYWPKIQKENFNRESGVVNKLESLVLPWVSSIEILENKLSEDIEVQILAETSSLSQLVAENYNLDPQGTPNAQADSKGKHVVAVYLSSSSAEATEDKGEDIKVNASSRIIVVSDADFISEGFIRRFPSNLVFAQNIIDALTVDPDLINIRSKRITERPLQELSDSARGAIKYLNIFGIAVLFSMFGIFRFVIRRRESRMNF